MSDKMYEIEKGSKEYLELWQFFAERGDYYKDKMWTITMWLFALLGGILGYMMKNFMGGRINKDGSVDESVWLIAEPGLCLIFSLFAIFFCKYIISTIKDYGNHIQHNWNRANYLLVKIEPLPELWYTTTDQQKINEEIEKNNEGMRKGNDIDELSAIPRRLISFTMGFRAIFILIMALCLIELIILMGS